MDLFPPITNLKNKTDKQTRREIVSILLGTVERTDYSCEHVHKLVSRNLCVLRISTHHERLTKPYLKKLVQHLSNVSRRPNKKAKVSEDLAETSNNVSLLPSSGVLQEIDDVVAKLTLSELKEMCREYVFICASLVTLLRFWHIATIRTLKVEWAKKKLAEHKLLTSGNAEPLYRRIVSSLIPVLKGTPDDPENKRLAKSQGTWHPNTFLIVLECGAPVCYCLNKLAEKQFKEGAHRGKAFLACADGTCTYQVLTWALAQVPLPTVHYLAPPTPGMQL